MDRVQVRQEIDRDLVEAEIEATAGAVADDLAQALRLIGSYGPPGGTQAEVDEAVAQQRADHPFTEIFNPILLAPGTSIPIFVAEDEAGRKAMATGRHRAFACNYFAVLLIDPMLHRAAEHHGRPDHDALTELWSTEVIGSERGERIARALELFLDGHPDDCAHLLVPRLESILRDLAQASGMLVRKAPKPGALGGVKSLGQVMRYLREVSDEDTWICHLEALLCDPLSLNLRNSLAHGLQGRVSAPGAALLLQSACYLMRLRPAGS